MRYESIFREYKILVSFLLLAVVPAGLRGGDHPRIKSIRTVVYEPILKDTSWVTGRVVDYIQFVKYDSKGRKVVENRLKPDGSPLGKLVYRYNADGQVAREIYATADKGVSNCWDYTYDANGHLNCIVTMDGQEDTIQIYSAQYSEDGKVLKKLNNDYKKKVLLGRQVVYDKDGHPVKVITTTGSNGEMRSLKDSGVERWDTTALKREGIRYLSKLRVVKDDEKKNPIRKTDEAGNWTERFEGCGEDGEPKFIVCRDIEYAGGGNDWEKLPVHGKVKKVRQTSYVAVPKGSQAVDKGEKKGCFFTCEFDENGKKTREEIFSDTGKSLKSVRYEYDEEGHLSKESYYTPAGVLIGSKDYAYDKEDRLKHCSVLDDKGEMVRRDILRYDLEDNPVRETGYKTDGTKCSEFRYMYDSYGQQIERQVLIQPEGEEPVSPVRRTYNFQGRVVGEQFLLPPGTGSNTYTYRYNAKGELISGTEQLDGQPEETKYVYKFHKDNRGNWKIRIKYVNDVPVVYEEREYVYYE